MSTALTTFDERYSAIAARDARFDGQFVTAVRSTGIYCRPSCPARTPKAVNVEFFATSAAAHEAGYRACKRCLPEAAPGSPQWNLRSDAAGRAMRLIADGVVEREGVSGLAARLGYSTRHLTRLLHAELGAGPLALARAHRAHTARMLLVGTELPASDVAFSAGFASVRQFNDTVRDVFGMPPLELRARRRRSDAHAPGRIELVLPYRAPLDAAGLFAWMRARAIAGTEVASASAYERVLRLPGGPAHVRIALESDASPVASAPATPRVSGVRGGATAPERLRLSVRVAQLGDLPAVVARARRLFDLDADPTAIDDALSRHPELAPLVARVPGIRVPGTLDPHEMLIRAMVGQQVTVAAARTALTRLTAALGDPVPTLSTPPMSHLCTETGGDSCTSETRAGGVDAEDPVPRLFPTMAAIAEHGADVLRGPAARIRALVGAATALAEGSLDLTSGDDGEQQRARLLALPGVGPWTADYVRMRVTGDPDVLLPGDVAARTGAAAAGVPADARALTDWAGRTSPWRSYLTAHLWRAAADQPTRTRLQKEPLA